MNYLPNQKVGTKLIGGFLVLTAVIVLLAVLAYLGINQVRDESMKIFSTNLISNTLVRDIQIEISSLRGNMFKYLLVTEQRSRLAAQIDTSMANIDRNIIQLEGMALGPEVQPAIGRLKTNWAGYREQLKTLRTTIDNSLARDLYASAFNGPEQARMSLDESASSLALLIKKDAEQKTAIENRAILNNMLGMGAIALVALAFALLVGIRLTNSIVIPLKKSVALLKEIGQGHLEERLPVDRKDELGDLIANLNQFADDLQTNVVDVMKKIAAGDLDVVVEARSERDEIGPALQQTVNALRGLEAEAMKLSNAAANGQIYVRGEEEQFQGGYRKIIQGFNSTLDLLSTPLKLIVVAANSLTSTAEELQSITTQQAAGAAEQSAAISQTTTTVDEVKAISEQASLRAQEVATSAQRTLDVARAGRQAVDDNIASMALIKARVESISENLLALSQQTQQIGEIINTVGELASQSNMLALNASVEAARAGEHGKGFSVVAQEVRSLADQSRAATLQIKGILSEIQRATNTTVMATEEGIKGVEVGVRTAAQANQAIEQLSAAVNESAQVAIQVSVGGQQQRTGVEQIAAAMMNINQATVQNLASTRQAEQSAHNLNRLARRMTDEMLKYKAF